MRSLITILILVFTCQFSFSQDKSKAVLIDEFDNLTCEEYWARIDNFINEFTQELQSKGYLIIYGKANNLFENLKYRQWARGIINFRGIDKSRLIIIEGKENRNLKIELWKVAADAEKPLFSETKWSYVLSNATKPFIFTAYSFQDGICPSESYVELFADFLAVNQNARGHIVIRDKTARNFYKTKKEVLKELVDQYNVPINRLKFFYHVDKSYSYDFTDVEFWFVPKKKK